MKWVKSYNPFDPCPFICSNCGGHMELPDEVCEHCGARAENPVQLLPEDDVELNEYMVSFRVRAADPDDVVDWLVAELRDEDWGGALISGFMVDMCEDSRKDW